MSQIARMSQTDSAETRPISLPDSEGADSEGAAERDPEPESTADAAEVVRIGLISDTHGWLDPAVGEHFADVALILHAGDVGNETILEDLTGIAPLVAVFGNVDGGPLRDLPEEVVLEVGDRRIAMRHIAGSPRRPNADAKRLIESEGPDIFVCGHSHIPAVGEVEGCLWINPGAAGREGPHEERMVHLLELYPDDDVKLLRVHLGPRSRFLQNA